jgi:hypothetical protein
MNQNGVFEASERIIERWVGQGQGTLESSAVTGGGDGQGGFFPGGIPLVAGQKYAMRVEQYEGGGGAGARLYWESATQPREIIQARHMYAFDATTPLRAVDTFTATAKFGGRAQLFWSDPNLTETGYEILRKGPTDADFVPAGTVGAGVTTFVDSGLTDGATYEYKVRARRNAEAGPDSLIESETAFITKISAPWTQNDVGPNASEPSIIGEASYDPNVGNGKFTISGGGHDIWDAADGFHFVHQKMTGDFVITAEVVDIQNTDAWAKAGVMVRETLDAGSRFAMMAVTPGNQAHLQGRRITGSGDGTTSLFNLAAPTGAVNGRGWVRLSRVGNTFTGQYSLDGLNWVSGGTQVFPGPNFPAEVYVGLATTAHNNSLIATSNIQNVSFGVPDTVAPVLSDVEVDGKIPAGLAYTPSQHLVLKFNEAVSGVAEQDFEMFVPGVGVVSVESFNVTYDPATNSALVTFEERPNSEIGFGNMVLYVQEAGITDAFGNPLDADGNGAVGQAQIPFYILKGDTQKAHDGTPLKDRTVDFIDYQIMQKNFGRTNASASEGDFNYDGTVDFNDFTLLYQGDTTAGTPPLFGTTLAAPAAPVASAPAPAPVPVVAAPTPAPVAKPAPVKKPAPVARPAPGPKPAPKASPVAKAAVLKAPAPKTFATKKIAKDLLA